MQPRDDKQRMANDGSVTDSVSTYTSALTTGLAALGLAVPNGSPPISRQSLGDKVTNQDSDDGHFAALENMELDDRKPAPPSLLRDDPTRSWTRERLRQQRMAVLRQPSVAAPLTRVMDYLRTVTCYSLLPLNSKLIVLDCDLLVRKALYALLQNGIRSAPLWDSVTRSFVGMLTATDFMQLILYLYASRGSYEEAMADINQCAVRSLRERRIIDLPDKIVSIPPMTTVFDAARTLLRAKIHRLPLIDTDKTTGAMTFVSVMTAYRVLNFIAANVHRGNEFRSFVVFIIQELALGTYASLVTGTPETSLIDVLRAFIKYHISALPIVDDNGTLLDVYEKYDVMVLARGDEPINLDRPVREAMLSRSEIFEGVHTCRVTDTLESMLAAIRQAPVHRFMVVDERNKLLGVVSLSDILAVLVGHTLEDGNSDKTRKH